MQACDLILKNAIILTMDEQYHIYSPGAIALQGDSILAVGHQADILNAYTAKDCQDLGGKLLMPGLVNTHTHVPMTLLRGLSDDLRLDVWLMGYMMPTEREFVTPEFVRLGTKLACAEFIRSGVTTFCDMYYFEDDVAEATVEAGLRALTTQTVMKFPCADAPSFDDALARSEALIKKWKGHALIYPGIAPHAVYTCTPEILRAVADMALKYDVPVHFHAAETADEVETLRKESGLPVIPYIRKFGLLETKLVLAHCVHLDEGEIRSIQHAGAGVAHNPSSNLKLASGFAPVAKMLELGVNVGIGTDGPASNNDLDMIEEIRLASLVGKTVAGDPTALPARQTLAMATSMGAKVLHMDDITGSLVPGKRADLITIDLSPLHNQPHFEHNPEGVYAQIIYAGKANDVTDVMVNGKWLMREKKLLTLDEQALIRDAQAVATEIDRFIKGREASVHSKLIAIGGASEEESFEVQAKVAISDPEAVLKRLKNPEIAIQRVRYYHEFDNYFSFDDPAQGRLRYREDEFLNEARETVSVRSRLTLIGSGKESLSPDQSDVLLSRSRYLAPATHSLRFYTEYFKPRTTVEVEKYRSRYLVTFRDCEFFINFDNIVKPHLGNFVEIKSRTWSRTDADDKSALMHELFALLGLDHNELINKDYIQMIEEQA